jgi:hypothetical protein
MCSSLTFSPLFLAVFTQVSESEFGFHADNFRQTKKAHEDGDGEVHQCADGISWIYDWAISILDFL